MSQADRELFERIAREEGLDLAGPSGVGDYLSWAWNSLMGWFGGMGAAEAWVLPAAQLVLWLLVAAAPALILWLVWPALRRLLWGEVIAPAALEVEALARIDGAGLRAELDALLAAGEARQALSRLWSWVVRGVVEGGRGQDEADLTNREFVASVRRDDPDWPHLAELRSLARGVDRLAYDRVEPDVAAVRGLLTGAETLLRGGADGASA